MDMKDYINQHRVERDRLLGLPYIERDGIEKAKNHLKSDLIKIISGPRRAGKSVFALSMLKDKNFAYVNFDDEALMSVLNLGNYDTLVDCLKELYPGFEFILFDEIQNLQNWEQFLNKLQRRGYNLVVTGSNAQLLSGEWATALTGRTIEMEVWPFSFGEYLKVKKMGTVNEYLQMGGYPEVVTKLLDPKTYMTGLLDSILIKDVTRRYQINRQQLLFDLNKYLLTQFTNEISFSNLAKIFELSSANTIQKFVRYLQNPYLYFLMDRFHAKPKLRITTPKKLYLVDTGFAPLGLSADTGKLLENAAFLSLLRRRYRPNSDLFSYKTRNNKEIDFVYRRGYKIEALVQVCADISNPKTLAREISALNEAENELECKDKIVVFMTGIMNDKTTAGIKFIKASDWL